MNRFLQLLVISCLSLAVAGCYSTEEPIGPDVPAVGSLKLSQEQMVVGSEGGEFSIDIFTKYTYETSVNADWITISGSTCGTEYCTLYFTVAKNNTTSEREGAITVFCNDYNLSATLTISQEAGIVVPTNEIWYTSSDGEVVTPCATDVFGANIVSNTYENGQGVITFDGNVTQIGEKAFNKCSSLTTITMPNSIKTIGILAFGVCSSLTNIDIPNSVTHIEERAFISCIGLTRVTLPESVISIGNRAFVNCQSLEGFYGKYASEDNRCLIIDGVLNAFAPAGLTEYTIPDGTTSIGQNAFWWNSATTGKESILESVTIPNSVTEIIIGAFSGCRNLVKVYCKPIVPPKGDVNMFDSIDSERKIYVPMESVEAYKALWSEYSSEIEGYDYGESNITALDRVLFYTSSDGAVVTPYNANAFDANIVSNTYANGQGIIIFDKEVTQIGEQAFYAANTTADGRRLTSMIIPNSVTSIKARAFYYCNTLTNLVVPDQITTIGEYAFYHCDALTNFTIPNEVTSIGLYAFYYCKSLTSISIPDGVTVIEDKTFYNCINATDLTIGKGVTSIGNEAFVYCSGLTSITIPDSVTSFGSKPFYSCSNLSAFYGKFASADNRCLIVDGTLISFAPADLTEYTIPEGVTAIGDYTFYTLSALTNIGIPDSVTSIGDHAFYNCTNLTDITLPKSLTHIGRYAFYYCNKIINITIPDGVTFIEEYAFYHCINLTSVNIPENTTAIASFAFAKCYSLTKANIYGDSLISIGDSAFYECKNIVDITIPSSVNMIGNSAFADCANLASIHCKSATPPNGGSQMFDNNAADRKIYVDYGSVSKYKRTNFWTNYADAICAEPDSITETQYKILYTSSNGQIVEPNATDVFGAKLMINKYENGVGTLYFESEITSIGDYAFKGCQTLTSITMPESITSIGDYAFNDCKALTSITIPEKVESIGTNAFYGCTGLSAIYGKYASTDNRCLVIDGVLSTFATAGITTYIIPEDVTAVGDLVFADCHNLAEITIGLNVALISDLAFYNCSGLKTLYCKPTIPPTLTFEALSCAKQLTTIYVPISNIDLYKVANGWKEFADKMVSYKFDGVGDFEGEEGTFN